MYDLYKNVHNMLYIMADSHVLSHTNYLERERAIRLSVSVYVCARVKEGTTHRTEYSYICTSI